LREALIVDLLHYKLEEIHIVAKLSREHIQTVINISFVLEILKILSDFQKNSSIKAQESLS